MLICVNMKPLILKVIRIILSPILEAIIVSLLYLFYRCYQSYCSNTFPKLRLCEKV